LPVVTLLSRGKTSGLSPPKKFVKETHMKTLSRGTIALAAILLSAPLIYGQDLSKYRDFSFGMSAARVSKLAEERPADLIVIHEQPALIQELTWYPPQPFASPRPAEPVQKVLFSFYNGELYRMLVTYDSDAIKGLTNEDMIQILSAKYGTATRPAADVNFPTNDLFRSTEKVIARWEDPQYSLNLFRSSMSDTFAVVMFTKQLDSQAASAIAESATLERQEAPQKEAARVKQAAVDLEAERQKNIKALRP
jgi:hypothetical protein